MPPLSNRRRKAIARLRRRKHRQDQGRTLLESRRALSAALDAGAPLVEVVVDADRQHEPGLYALLSRLAAETSVPVHTADADTLRQVTDVETSQGVVAVVKTPLLDADAVPEALPDAAAVLVLDGVQDPGNVGTIVRTAAWFGADAVVAGGH